jgi:hypothetical protein
MDVNLCKSVAPFASATPRVSIFDDFAKQSGPAPNSYDPDPTVFTGILDPSVVIGHVKAVPFAASKVSFVSQNCFRDQFY